MNSSDVLHLGHLWPCCGSFYTDIIFFKNETYTNGECTFVGSPDGRPWCMTENNKEDKQLDTDFSWDYCNDNCGKVILEPSID